MSSGPTQRPDWKIDQRLDGLIDANVRVAAKSFSPTLRTGDASPRFIPVRDLFLPDNSQPAGLPVFFEGRLRKFERQIGVVFVWLDSPTLPNGAAEGPVYYRGKMAVILRGPAVVELAWPFQVERLPADPANYWRDLRVPRAQFEFPFSAGTGTGNNNEDSLSATATTGLPAAVAASTVVRSSRPPERRLDPVDSSASIAVDGVHGGSAVKGDRCGPEPGGTPTTICSLSCSHLTD